MMMNTGYFITEAFRRPEAWQAGVDEKINSWVTHVTEAERLSDIGLK